MRPTPHRSAIRRQIPYLIDCPKPPFFDWAYEIKARRPSADHSPSRRGAAYCGQASFLAGKETGLLALIGEH
jgi:hypothetical protein